MDTNDEVRRRRLKLLAESVGLAEIEKKTGRSAAYLTHIIQRHKGAKKQDGSQSVVNLGDPAARDIETGLELPAGWLDWPLDAVSFKAWARLDKEGRAYVQGKMVGALEDRLGRLPQDFINTSAPQMDESASQAAIREGEHEANNRMKPLRRSIKPRQDRKQKD